ncbi:MAG: cysteine peptidase family C39 domain-containing protein [Desulfuromusa sp.]|nr:cysteine peptidase family C39 domain-containing protein [Desulfuromusa sp.]
MICSCRCLARVSLLSVLLLSCVSIAPVEAASRVGIRLGNVYLSQNVQSVLELRWNKLTRQGWDISCGAAALSTLLTYHNGRQFSEISITLSILKNSDPVLVRKRGGFSLFDLKRFVQAVGLEGLGFGDMTLDELDHFVAPAILPIRIKGFDHFVVFRGRLGDHVLIGDPAFGNTSIPAARFMQMWQSRIAFYVVTHEEKQMMTEQGKGLGRSPMSPEAMEVAIPSLNYASRVLRRMPLIPVTRRSVVVR